VIFPPLVCLCVCVSVCLCVCVSVCLCVCVSVLRAQFAAYLRDPHPSIECFVCESNTSFWQFLLSGPGGTPYEGAFALVGVEGDVQC
jgi:hypothetical protein